MFVEHLPSKGGAGVTDVHLIVIPDAIGDPGIVIPDMIGDPGGSWIPAFAGMTVVR